MSDDNAFVESLFRTAKYRPEFPDKGFANLHEARAWAARFVHWYNHEHRHSAIRYVSPAQRHAGQDKVMLAARHELYCRARQRNPGRWSRSTRDWTPIDTVTLNPERESIVKTHSCPTANNCMNEATSSLTRAERNVAHNSSGDAPPSAGAHTKVPK